MGKAKKIGILIILIGLFLPTVTLPFITEFYPLPEVCLTSNFFGNLGNMEIVFRPGQATEIDKAEATGYRAKIAVPYRYIFALGVILVCAGTGIMVITSGGRN